MEILPKSRRAAIFLFIAVFMSDACAQSNVPCETQMMSASRKYGIPVEILYSIGLVESGNGARLSPFALNLAGTPVIAKSLDEALKIVADARGRGIKLIDAGCMQINMFYHGKSFTSQSSFFDPATNVAYAAQFLAQLRGISGNWTNAVARYHAGPGRPEAQRAYLCRVLARMAGSGLGAPTGEAQSYCSTRSVNLGGNSVAQGDARTRSR